MFHQLLHFRRLNPIHCYCSPEPGLTLVEGDTVLQCHFSLLSMVKSLLADTKFKEIQLLEELDCFHPQVMNRNKSYSSFKSLQNTAKTKRGGVSPSRIIRHSSSECNVQKTPPLSSIEERSTVMTNAPSSCAKKQNGIVSIECLM